MQMTEFRNMPYTRPDLAAYGEQMRQTAKILREAKTYEEARKAYAVIATGESAIYANIILQKGVI